MTREHNDQIDALRRIEEIEGELAELEGLEDIRERLTDARSDLGDALLEEELKD